MDNVVMPTPRVLALRAARAAPPKRRPRAQRAAGGRGRGCVGSHSNWVSRIGSVALTRNAGVHCICSSPGWGPGVAKGARSAPRPTMQRTGATRSASGLDEKLGVSRILRLGGKARAPPRRGATLSRLHVPAIRRQILRERALAMRAAPTSSEEALWRLLRARQLGVCFRRQVPLGCASGPRAGAPRLSRAAAARPPGARVSGGGFGADSYGAGGVSDGPETGRCWQAPEPLRY